MIIGYSFWGFLGPGITDTPDGGRSHRRPFVDAIAARGHHLIFLQKDRDRLEAGDALDNKYSFDNGLPKLDVLFLEWRWPIPGRNTTPCGTPGHTCDLHRQAELLEHYTLGRRTPTVIWDKDRQLATDDPWRHRAGVVVCEAALKPTRGAVRLLFPVADSLLDSADPYALATRPRPLTLAYVGNQHDRADAFDAYFAPAAEGVRHEVGGKWADSRRWPHVDFRGRVPFAEVSRLYGSAVATILLLPQRYARVGQMTQRIFEAVLAGCLPITPAEIHAADRFTPRRLHVRDGKDVITLLDELREMAGTQRHERLIADCLRHLDLFRLSRQMTAFDAVLDKLDHTPTVSAGRMVS
jgi:hypothetical protein